MLATVPFQAAQSEQEANLWKPRRKLNCPRISRAACTVQNAEPGVPVGKQVLNLISE